MKYQIRQGVFETNSSSTHSLQITTNSLEEVTNTIHNRISKIYNRDTFDVDDYMDKWQKTLNLTGLDVESGDEETCIYYILKNWMAKLQYLVSYIWAYRDDIPGYAFSEHQDFRTPEHYKVESVKSTEIYKILEELALEVANKNGYDINQVNFDPSETIYTDGDLGWAEEFNDGSILKKPEHFKEMITPMLFDDNVIICYMDEAYHPYKSPKIYVY